MTKKSHCLVSTVLLGFMTGLLIRTMEGPALASALVCGYEEIEYQLEEFVRTEGTAPVESQSRWWKPRAILNAQVPDLTLDDYDPNNGADGLPLEVVEP